MSSVHQEIVFFRGDPLKLRGTLLDQNGSPIALDEAIVEWGLTNEMQERVLALGVGNGIGVLDASAGLCLITVATHDIPPGRYTDQLRVTVNGDISTVWVGPLLCKEAPLALAGR